MSPLRRRRDRDDIGSRSMILDIADRASQDELLQIRNDLMTLYRPVDGAVGPLFPLRYARSGPSARARRRLAAARSRGTDGSPVAEGETHAPGTVGPSGAGEAPAPLPPILVIPDGPALASVLPYDVLRRMMNDRGLDVLMVEHRGVGLSRLDAEGRDLPRSAMRIEHVVEDLVAVLDHAGVARAAVYGSGYGAYLAQILAALHPDRVHSLVLDSPISGADDEAAGQEALRARYWEGDGPEGVRVAAAVRDLVERREIDGATVGPVLRAVHEYGGGGAVRELVGLLEEGRGHLTLRSAEQVLERESMLSTPYVIENDLVRPIAHTQLGRGRHADGRPLDPLSRLGAAARRAAPFDGEAYDVRALSRTITAPTLVLAGEEDLTTPVRLAEETAARIPGAVLLRMPGLGHSILDAHPTLAIIAAWWSAAGAGRLLPERARDLARIPRASVPRAVGQGLRLALLAERLSPVRLRLESARSRHLDAPIDPQARRARRRAVR
ncbi:alpha/beta fold hydrolase [Brachybacterium huguangmaarense]